MGIGRLLQSADGKSGQWVRALRGDIIVPHSGITKICRETLVTYL